MATVGSLEGLRELNRLRVIDALRRRGTASRSELARATGLSRTTVTTLVTELQGRGLVVEQPPPASRRRAAGRGRPPILLRLDPSAGAVVGIHFDHRHLRVAVADLSSTVLVERLVELDVDHCCRNGARRGGRARRRRARRGGHRARARGRRRDGAVGADRRSTAPSDSTVILPGWDGLSAAERALGAARPARRGRQRRESRRARRGLVRRRPRPRGRDLRDGLVRDRRRDRDRRPAPSRRRPASPASSATSASAPKGAVCRCGNRGCLETVASTDALLELLRPAHGRDLTSAGCVELLAGDDPARTRVVNDAGRAIGRVLAGLCNILSPAAVIVGGDLERRGRAAAHRDPRGDRPLRPAERAGGARGEGRRARRSRRGARRARARDRRHRSAPLGRPRGASSARPSPRSHDDAPLTASRLARQNHRRERRRSQHVPSEEEEKLLRIPTYSA